MKVLHLSTVDFWGYGISAYRLHKRLQAKGIDSIMITMVKSTGDPSVKMVIFDPLDKNKFHVFDKVIPDTETISNYMIEKWNNLLKMQVMPSEGELIFSSYDSVVNLEEIIELNNPDIIHIHWAPGLVDIEKAPIYFMNKNICLTIYDMYPFSGGCHNEKCEGFKEECRQCYLLKKEELKKIANINFNIKKKSYDLLKLHVVASNKILKRKSEESKIFGVDNKIEVIYPGVPVEKFSKKNKKQIRKYLQLPIDKYILILACSSLKNKRKNINYLIEGLKSLKEKGKEFYFIIIGAYAEEIKKKLHFPIHTIGFVPYEEIMCWYYSASDLFLNPSIQINIPISVLEAMACGLPVVSFNYGGIKEVISHKKNGYLAELYNMEDFINGIKWILRNRENIKLELNSKKTIKHFFNLDIVTVEYIKLYEEILKNNIGKDRLKNKIIKWGEIFFKNKDIEKSLLVFNKILEQYGDDAEVFNNIGVIYWEKGDYENAIKFFKKAYKLKPFLKEIRENYINALTLRGKK